jgi:hypothetical protein
MLLILLMLNIDDVNIIDDKNKIINFIKYIKTVSNKLIGIDFEFNNIKYNSGSKREIALMQINIYNSDKKIFIINPLDMNKSQIEVLKTLLFKNKIIMHGAESLDIPNMFNKFLVNDNERIFFLKNYIDTKFLCEYNNIIINENKKCKIYELLLNQKVINQEIYNYLEKNEEKMGHIYEIFIDIKKLKDNKNLIYYSSYDVYYLGELYISLLKTLQSLQIDIELFMDFIRLIILIRYNNNLDNYSAYLNKMNNYIFYINNNVKRLNDIFQEKITKNNQRLNLPKLIKILLKIPFLKKLIEIIIKHQVYKEIIDNNIVYVKKDIIFNEKFNIINKFIKELEFFPKIYNYLNK